MKPIILLWATILTLSIMCIAFGQVPQVLSYQGALLDTSGAPMPDGEYRFTLRIYPDSIGGTPLWMGERLVQVRRGLFSTQLGGTPGFGSLFTAQRWLSVQVGSDPEIPRRIPLLATAYSFRSTRSDTAQVALTAPLQQVVDSARIAGTVPDGAITNAKLAANAVTTDKILNGTIQRVDVAANFKAPAADTADFVRNLPPIDSARIAGTVPDGAITNAKLAANAVTTDKIADGTILTADVAATFKAPDALIADSARRAPPSVIPAGSIDSTKLAVNAVVNSRIHDGAISSAKIAAGQVVKSLNNVRDDIRLVGRGAASITSSNDTIYIETPPPSGGTGIQSLSNTNNTLTIINPTGPNAVVNVRDAGIGSLQLADAAVQRAKIADTAVSAQKIADGAVLAAKLANGAVENAKLAANAVTTDKILDGTILFQDIGQNGAAVGQIIKWTGTAWAPRNDSLGAAGVTSVTAGTGLTASPNPITTTGTISIAPGGVTSALLASSAVDSTKIAAGAVNTTHIANAAVTSAKLAANSVNTGNIADGTILLQDIGQNGAAVGQVMKWTGTGWAVRNDSIDGVGITSLSAGTPGAVTGTSGLTLSPNPITSSGTIAIANSGVTNAMLAAGSVDSAKIASSAINTVHLANAAVTNAKLGPNAVTTDKILDGSILFQDIGQNGAAVGQVMKWTGTAWAPRNDSLGTGGIGGSGVAGQVSFWNSATSLSGSNSFFWDNTNQRLGLGTASPYTQFTLTSTLGFTNATTPLVYSYQSGTSNPRRTLLAHSPNFSQWGLGYNDLTDQMIFQQDTLNPVLAIGIGSKSIGVNTATPEGVLDVRGGTVGLVLQNSVGTNSDDIMIKRPGPISPANIRFSLSERGTNTDLWLYGWDGTTFKNFIGFEFSGNYVTAPAGDSTLVVDIDSARVGVGTRAPTEKLDVDGNIRVRNMPVFQPSGDVYDVYAFPDGTFFTILTIPNRGVPSNLRELENPNRVLQVSPVQFTWERTGQRDIGLMPEDIRRVIPELVTEKSESHPEGIKYDKISLYLLEVVKDQQKEIAALQEKLKQLEQRIETSARGSK
jgi:hypothetical protein